MSWGVLGYPGVSWGNKSDPRGGVAEYKEKALSRGPVPDP